MQLSDVGAICNVEVRRDGSFRSLGLLSHDLNELLVVLYDQDYLPKLLSNSSVSCVITKPQFADAVPPSVGVAVADDPLAVFHRIHAYLLSETEFYGGSFESRVSPDAVIHETAWIAPLNVQIGSNARIGPRAIIHERTTVYDNVVIGAGAVIGGEGFEPKKVNGSHILVRHAGGVVLRSGVEILCNSHVAKAVYNGNTEIGEDTKIDALVHIAHNVRIGRRCEIAAGAVLAGSSAIGDDVWIGPRVVVSSEVKVGDRAFVAIGSVAIKDVSEDDKVFGVPAKSIKR